MFRGYGGYYKETYLRSSLEFAYAYYLDSKNIKWKYELKRFDLEGISYKPDFYIMKDEEIDYIVEIKSEENKYEGIQKVTKLKELYNLDVRLITYKDLLKIYQNEMPISLNKARVMWKEEYKTSYSQNVTGENNPMFGKTHSESTKLILSEKGKERFKNEQFKNKMMISAIESNRKNGYSAQKQPRSKRETRNCENPECNESFVVTVSSKKKFCSQQCAAKIASLLGAKAEIEKSRKLLDQVKDYIIEWAKNNQALIQETPYNKIKTNLSELFTNINKLFNIKDMRIISKAVFGEDKGRKQLLTYLKEIN